MKKYLTFIFLFALLCCSEQKDPLGGPGYMKDSTISTKDGILLRGDVQSLPRYLYFDSSWVDFYDPGDTLRGEYRYFTNEKNKKDSIFLFDFNRLFFYSNLIKNYKVPILYNYYSGCDIYRFTWDHSFYHSLMFTVNKSNNDITLNVKSLLDQLAERSYLNIDIPKENIEFRTNEDSLNFAVGNEFSVFFVKPLIVFDTTFNISKENWEELESLIEKGNLWSLFPPYVEKCGVDGGTEIFEGHIREKYYCVIREFDCPEIARCRRYLLSLCGSLVNERFRR